MRARRAGGRWAQRQRSQTDHLPSCPATAVPRQRPEGKGVRDARLSTALTRLFPHLRAAIEATSDAQLLEMTEPATVVQVLGPRVLKQRRGGDVIAGTVRNFKEQRGLV